MVVAAGGGRVVAAERGHGGHRGQRDGQLGGHGEGRVPPHPGAARDAGRQRLAGGGGLGLGGGGGPRRAGQGVGAGGLQGLLRHFGLGRECLGAGVHERGAHLWLVVGSARPPHPVKADPRRVGGATVGGLAQVGGLGGHEEPPDGLRGVMHQGGGAGGAGQQRSRPAAERSERVWRAPEQRPWRKPQPGK